MPSESSSTKPLWTFFSGENAVCQRQSVSALINCSYSNYFTDYQAFQPIKSILDYWIPWTGMLYVLYWTRGLINPEPSLPHESCRPCHRPRAIAFSLLGETTGWKGLLRPKGCSGHWVMATFPLLVCSWFLHNSGSCFNTESPREVRSDVSHGLSSLDLSAFLSIQVLWCVPVSDLGTLGSAPTGIELLFFGSAALYPGIILSNVKNLSDACLIRQVQHAIVIRRWMDARH